MHETRNDLPAQTRKRVIATLSPLLADTFDLYSQIKQAHWNVRGPSFQTLHELFDATATQVLAGVDEIAERILQLGGEAEGTARNVAKATRLQDYPLTLGSGEQHVDAVTKAMSACIGGLRKGIDETDDAGDAVTADILTGITRGLDKQLWFIEAHLLKGK